ncbi:cilia- and flagella-associated protein 61-like [Hermetia illucens]|uniref:cilia- and flagella-associated protein 61-like n=1 Tax=Hermetia illucens TaxID=343691 RepID=UPI0018CC0DCB|nr:cilia- and flagella-associated protein 61-like [Hermetia illucens]
MCTDFLSNPICVYDILMVRSEGTIVGIIILKPATTVDHMRRNYSLDAYENFDIASSPASYGQIIYSYISPLFVSCATFIFKEIFRITSYTSVHYSIRSESKYVDFYNSLLPTMFPIKPRRILVLPDIETFDDIEPDPKAFAETGTSAIYYTNLRLCAFKRKQIDARLVVIGFGLTSKAFLETLIYRSESQHLRFTNLTCICPAGILEANMTYVSNYAKLSSPDRLFPSDYLRQLEMRAWVNFVPGYMSRIDRKNKYVILDSKERVPYDKLFLFCGVQFDVPVEVYSEKTPYNLVLINKSLHGKMVNYRIRSLIKNSGYKIIVYGCLPKTFAGVNYLLNAGVKGKDIYLIVQPLETHEGHNIQTFDDDFVESVVYRELSKANVNVYRNFKFVMWKIDKEANVIKDITFESRFECIKLPCALFISYNRKVVNRITVRALNRSGLVFDGRIVIDANNRTNDPNIYAAGPLTKYRRILYADRYRHIYYNSKEIGMQLALRLVENYSRRGAEANQQEPPFKWIVPHYSFPIVESIILPGNYYYMHIRRPGFQLPNFLERSLDQYGMDLITGGSAILDDRLASKWNIVEEQLSAERDYCRIYIDKHGFVKTIVCLSRKPFKVQNMIRMYGMHEKLLNNMKCKYLNGEITDFFEFFSGRWSHILHHDRFGKLQEINERIYRYNLDGNTNWLTEYLQLETMGHKRELSSKTREALINYYQSDEFAVRIQRNLLNFINEYKETLFMYATPEILAKEYGNLQN